MATLWEFTVLLILILINGYLSMAEFALVAASPFRLESMVLEERKATKAARTAKSAKAALALKQDPNRFLSAIQVGVTLVGIFTGAYAAASFSPLLVPFFSLFPLTGPYAETISFVLVLVLVTYIALVIGEVAPKRIGIHNPEKIAAMVARPITALTVVTAPVVALLSVSTDGVLWLLRIRERPGPRVTEEEIRILVREGTEEGVLEREEQEMVEGVFNLGDRKVYSVMTARPDIAAIDLADPLEQNLRVMETKRHSRYPVYRENLDNILGIVWIGDVRAAEIRGKVPDFRGILREPQFIPENAPVLRALETFKHTGAAFAVVVDEYGGVAGILTPHDLMEAIVGEFTTQGSPDERMVVQREDGSYLVDGLYPIDGVQELLEAGPLPDQENFHTLAGFVMLRLGRIPVTGDHFDWEKWRFEVVDMDGRRVDKVLLSPLEPVETLTAPEERSE
ncbi:putative hemolysin [Methanolinea mesophila]|uniref:hemolysin family protein n=1 Tax=Methanolinea mesophila TaxID=547055 RepID=UPI001AEAE112|nr:hemolysin family protein [Methanolinea mesophila]MBP1929524.1 putative hemolysin [Methanolinea mesophila]